MDERTFNALAETTLRQLEEALESCGVDLDVETKPGGVLELEFQDGSKAIVNRHVGAQEIWLAARSGGFHFRADGPRWTGTRDGEELFAAVSRVIREQSGCDVMLVRPV
jgi:CyaY protein